MEKTEHVLVPQLKEQLRTGKMDRREFLRFAVLLGVWFLVEAHRLSARARAGADPKPMRLFHMSISYLTLLFAAVAVGQFLPLH